MRKILIDGKIYNVFGIHKVHHRFAQLFAGEGSQPTGCYSVPAYWYNDPSMPGVRTGGHLFRHYSGD